MKFLATLFFTIYLAGGALVVAMPVSADGGVAAGGYNGSSAHGGNHGGG